MALGGERNKTKQRQGGLTLTRDGHWKAHKLQDDDGQTQTSDSWAEDAPLPPCTIIVVVDCEIHHKMEGRMKEKRSDGIAGTQLLRKLPEVSMKKFNLRKIVRRLVPARSWRV